MKKRGLWWQCIGMTLVLFSSGWQLFVDLPIAEAKSAGNQYHQNQKVDAIWGTLLDIYTHQFPDRAEMISFATVREYDKLFRQRVRGPIEWQAQISSWIKGIIFLFGGFLIIIGKWFEFKAEDEKKAAVESHEALVRRRSEVDMARVDLPASCPPKFFSYPTVHSEDAGPDSDA